MSRKAVSEQVCLPEADIIDIDGAITAFYPGVLDRLHELFGGDFYLVFDSTQGVQIHSVDGRFPLKRLQKKLRNWNRYKKKPEDILSRRVYRYDGKNIVEA